MVYFTPPRAEPPPKSRPKRTKWEYQGRLGISLETLNELGGGGWELISALVVNTGSGTAIQYFLKRLVKEELNND